MHTQRAHYLPARSLQAVALLWTIPIVAAAQAQNSPFMTGATALQTNLLAWLTPIAIILVMALGAMAMANRMHLKMEQRGLHSELAERLRAEYRERVACRLERAAAREVPGVAPAEQQAVSTEAGGRVATADVEELRRRAREAWLQLRSKEQQASSGQTLEQRHGNVRETHEQDTAVSRSPQDDFAL